MASTFDIASQNNAGVLNGNSNEASISADGNIVAFKSFDPVTGKDQIYAKNEATSALTLVSQSTGGVASNGTDYFPAISADGTSVGFDSVASNLAAGATTGNDEVYVKNLQTNGLTLVSQTMSGTVADNTSEYAALSANGNIVAFDSNATNLGLGASGAVREIYVKNIASGALTLASQTSTGTLGNGQSYSDSISADGNTVVFESTSTDLGSGSGADEVYVKNVSSGALTIASQASDGTIANGTSYSGSVSGDGTLVAFQSSATNLFAGATGGNNEVYLKNLPSGALSLISAKADGTIANGNSDTPVISADGRFATFESTATNLVAGATSGTRQVYVKNLQTGALSLLSQDSTGTAGNNQSETNYPSEQAFSANDTRTVFSTNATNLASTPAGTEVVLRDTTTAPSLTLNNIAGDNIINASEAASPVTISGTSDAIGQTVSVGLDTAGNSLGSATVQPDGTWSFTTNAGAISQGNHTAVATIQGTSYLSTTKNEAFLEDTSAPTVAFPTVSFTDTGVQGDGITNNGAVTLSGTVADNIGPSTVEVFDGSTDLGAATVSGGSWTLSTTLGQGTHNSFSAKATDEAGNTATATNSTSVTVDTIAPTVAFTPGVTFSNAHTATLNGTVSDPSSPVTGVEIVDNGTDLGAATLNGDGTWTLADAHLTSGMQNLTATATDAAGNMSQPTPPPFTLETGIRGQPYSSDEEDFDSQGNLTAETFTKRNGAVYLTDFVVNQANGDHVIDSYGGTYFNNKNFYYKKDVFAADYSQKTETLYNNDGSHTITGFSSGEKFFSLHDDTLNGGGLNETFVFKPHFGQDLITDFAAAGAGHDILSLSATEFSSIAQVLSHTQNVNGSAVIHVDAHDTITLQNVTKAELKAHPNDFSFHA